MDDKECSKVNDRLGGTTDNAPDEPGIVKRVRKLSEYQPPGFIKCSNDSDRLLTANITPLASNLCCCDSVCACDAVNASTCGCHEVCTCDNVCTCDSECSCVNYTCSCVNYTCSCVNHTTYSTYYKTYYTYQTYYTYYYR